MAWNLKSNGLHRYSVKETRVFYLLPKDGTAIDTATLVDAYYNGKEAPLHGQVSINGAMRSLTEKIVRNKEPFRIVKSDRRGPHPMEYRIAKK